MVPYSAFVPEDAAAPQAGAVKQGTGKQAEPNPVIHWLAELVPALAKPIFTVVAVLGIVAEAALMLWLLVKGVNEDHWKRMALAQSS